MRYWLKTLIALAIVFSVPITVIVVATIMEHLGLVNCCADAFWNK